MQTDIPGAFVLGLGTSGRSAVELLFSQGKRVVAADQKADVLRKDPAVQSLIERGLNLYSDRQDIDWKGIGIVILSPGVPSSHPLAIAAQARGIEVVGEIEFAFRSIRNRCVGITGTNGKTTVTMLVAHILQQAGRKAKALGNIGASLSGYALNIDPEEILVVELSSFQLESLSCRCLDAAVFLNLTPDHLDRYASLEDYAKAKCRIEDCLKAGQQLWVSREVERVYGSLLKRAKAFDSEACATPWEEESAPASAMSYIRLGMPEKQNIQAAYALCAHFGISDGEFCRGLKAFRKPHHRIEYVREWDGVFFYDDSKATNIDAAMHAVALFDGPIILLAGGVDKGASYLPWASAFQKKVVRIVAFGQAGKLIANELKDHFPIHRVETMREAVVCAALEARAKMSVLLSPGCSSFDEFRNYEHRGNEFKRMVEERIWIEKKRS